VNCTSESESELVYYWRHIANQFVLAKTPWDTRPAFIFQLNTCFHNPDVTSTLTRGWTCRLKLLLAFASAVILRSETRRTHDHILLSQIRVLQLGGPGPRIYIPQEQGGPVIPPGIADQCAPWKISNSAQKPVSQTLQFNEEGMCH
jgi:hypothetical protein